LDSGVDPRLDPSSAHRALRNALSMRSAARRLA